MNTTDNRNPSNKLEMKMPFFISIIFLIIIVIFLYKIFNFSAMKNPVHSIQEIQDIHSAPTLTESNEQLDEDTEKNDEEKTLLYTAKNGEKYEIIATLNIPSLQINYPVLSSTSTELLKVALNKYWGPNPNEVGNLVILGHNYENSKFFSKLHKIKIGDIVQITDINENTLDYTVYETDIIDPDNNDCTSQLTNGHTEITLITCHNKALDRFIVKARAK